MRVNNELIKFEFRESKDYKFDKKLLIRVQFYPNYFFEYIKKDCEDRYFADYFTPEEAESVDDFILDILHIPEEFDFTIGIEGGRGNCITYDAEFRRNFRYDHKWSQMLVIMEKPISFNPFYKCAKHDYHPKRITVDGKKCKTYDEALEEIRKWFANFKEETDGYQNTQQE